MLLGALSPLLPASQVCLLLVTSLMAGTQRLPGVFFDPVTFKGHLRRAPLTHSERTSLLSPGIPVRSSLTTVRGAGVDVLLCGCTSQ